MRKEKEILIHSNWIGDILSAVSLQSASGQQLLPVSIEKIVALKATSRRTSLFLRYQKYFAKGSEENMYNKHTTLQKTCLF